MTAVRTITSTILAAAFAAGISGAAMAGEKKQAQTGATTTPTNLTTQADNNTSASTGALALKTNAGDRWNSGD